MTMGYGHRLASSVLAAPLLSLSLISSLAGCGAPTNEVQSAGDPINCRCEPTEATRVRNAKPGLGTISIIGDSLARGRGTDESSPYVPAQCLKNAFNATINPLAINGLTSEGTLSEVNAAIAAGSRLVFVSSGGNDAIRDTVQPGSYPVSKSLREMEVVFDRLLDSGAVVVYLGLRPPFSGSERLSKIWDLATKKGVIVIDGMKDLWDDPTKMADSVHPNEAGYTKMCERIVEGIGASYP